MLPNWRERVSEWERVVGGVILRSSQRSAKVYYPWGNKRRDLKPASLPYDSSSIGDFLLLNGQGHLLHRQYFSISHVNMFLLCTI